MAFVFIGDRFSPTEKGKDGLGPGSYIGHKTYDRVSGYAPFASQTKRSIEDSNVNAKNKAPGPGFYSPNTGFDKINHDVTSMKAL